MLQQLADTLKAQQLAAVEATEQAKRRADGLKQVLREVRRNVAPPSIAIAEPERFPMEDPREVPTGAPFILNPLLPWLESVARGMEMRLLPYR
jgi:hypothetical protein